MWSFNPRNSLCVLKMSEPVSLCPSCISLRISVSLLFSLTFFLSIDLYSSPILSSAPQFPYNSHILILPRIPNLCPTFLLLSHFPLFCRVESVPLLLHLVFPLLLISLPFIHPSPEYLTSVLLSPVCSNFGYFLSRFPSLFPSPSYSISFQHLSYRLPYLLSFHIPLKPSLTPPLCPT